MSLKEDSKAVIEELLGKNAADSLDFFDDPVKYPKDFLEECTFFLSKITGEQVAKKKFMPLYKKYKVKL